MSITDLNVGNARGVPGATKTAAEASFGRDKEKRWETVQGSRYECPQDVTQVQTQQSGPIRSAQGGLEGSKGRDYPEQSRP